MKIGFIGLGHMGSGMCGGEPLRKVDADRARGDVKGAFAQADEHFIVPERQVPAPVYKTYGKLTAQDAAGIGA